MNSTTRHILDLSRRGLLRGATASAALAFLLPAPARQSPDLVFLAGVEPDGTVRYLFAESAGATGESLESAAAEFLRGVRFTPSASQQTEWGFVRFRWGTPPPPAIPE